MHDEYESLLLDRQLCFPLYAASREIIKHYRPFLDELDITYTQYITMMVLWEEEEISVKRLGKRLFLDSGTLTPLLKALEQKGYVVRSRSKADERILLVRLTEKGAALRDRALTVPEQVRKCVCLTEEEAMVLYRLLYKLLDPGVMVEDLPEENTIAAE